MQSMTWPMPSPAEQPAVVTMALAHRIAAISHARDDVVKRDEPYATAHLWIRFYRHMAMILRLVNLGIENPGTVNVFSRIIEILHCEVSEK